MLPARPPPRRPASRATGPSRSPRSPAAPTPRIRASSSPPACWRARRARLGLAPPGWVEDLAGTGIADGGAHPAPRRPLEDLEAVGFGIVGYGCTTCIGNSGPLTPAIERAVAARILPVAVLSGNRNFPGRVHPQLEAGFLASPPLVVAFALAGDVNRNILTDPIGRSAAGAEIRLADLWPAGRRSTRRCAAAV